MRQNLPGQFYWDLTGVDQQAGRFLCRITYQFCYRRYLVFKKVCRWKILHLPHVIELMQADYDELFPVLNTQPEIEVLVNPFVNGLSKRCDANNSRPGGIWGGGGGAVLVLGIIGQ